MYKYINIGIDIGQYVEALRPLKINLQCKPNDLYILHIQSICVLFITENIKYIYILI